MVLTQKLSPMYCKLHARGPCRPESREYFVLSTGVALQTQSASTKWFRVYDVNKPGGKISSFCAIGHCMGADSQAAACCSD
ncbi:hypothetical protein V1477_015011 [Vespula maculifrons]|uniref:Uncharacterized protein n=1 Tax=Vespula maculifrons TaxID=7453 RepID=A0ABD2BJ33_VESMC